MFRDGVPVFVSEGAAGDCDCCGGGGGVTCNDCDPPLAESYSVVVTLADAYSTTYTATANYLPGLFCVWLWYDPDNAFQGSTFVGGFGGGWTGFIINRDGDSFTLPRTGTPSSCDPTGTYSDGSGSTVVVS